ncbi:hypothetical protein N8X83_00890, partial [Alphaproteobacteria bacterium]|nr:hypothetical protein [Alphaproteobacteria bacterium]
MNIAEIYNKHSKNFLFNDSEKFLNLRKDLINNFKITPKIKKNNESLKYLDPQVLDLYYNYKKVD